MTPVIGALGFGRGSPKPDPRHLSRCRCGGLECVDHRGWSCRDPAPFEVPQRRDDSFAPDRGGYLLLLNEVDTALVAAIEGSTLDSRLSQFSPAPVQECSLNESDEAASQR